MSKPAWYITISSLKLSIAMLFCALLILISVDRVTTDTYYLYKAALIMAEAPVTIILLFGIGGLILENFLQNQNK